MSRYLVVAHQTTATPDLMGALRRLAKKDADAAFTLLVPATPVQHLMTWTEGESVAEARRAAEAGRARMEAAGLRVEHAIIGDPSPLEAIADALRDDAAFTTIVISTLPPGASRWLRRDLHARARRRFGLPVIAVTARVPAPV